MFAPSWPVRTLIERLVVEPSLRLLTSPGLLPRPVQLFRKALLVDRVAGAASYLAWYAKARLASRARRHGR